MKQVKKIENYLCLEARVQCHNKWILLSKDQRLLLYPDYDVVCRYAECCSQAVGYVKGKGTGRVGTLRN